MDSVDVLAFLFLISSLELGVAYSTENLDDAQLNMLNHLEELGIVFRPKDLESDDPADWQPEDYFYPTRLATTLTSDSDTTISATNSTLGSSLASNSGANKGFIIIETNYRFYAYTSSPLQIALINLFVRVGSRHPNLITGKLTKTSVARAIQAGITAEQIISYLAAHAHPQMRRHAQTEQARLQAQQADTSENSSVLPRTITDQIRLWQFERDRMTTTAGYLLKDFPNHSEYEAPCRYADEIGVLVWKNDRKRMFFVSRIEGVRTFMADRKTVGQG